MGGAQKASLHGAGLHGAGLHIVRQSQLRGPSLRLDPRVNAFRPDIADIGLADRVIAARYADPLPRRCAAPFAMLHKAPAADSVCISALLWGEGFNVVDVADGWAWGACTHDGYVGYVSAAALAAPGPAPTHRVSVPDALLFAAADIKAPVLAVLSLGSQLGVSAVCGAFVEIAQGFVHQRHVRSLTGGIADARAAMLDAARSLIGTPYRWGGRMRGGIDCSGLVQVALAAAGMAAPRDSDLQAQLGEAIAFEARAAGDLLCFPGHIGLLESPDTLLHANAFWMATVAEPLADVLARLPVACPDVPVSVRRLLA